MPTMNLQREAIQLEFEKTLQSIQDKSGPQIVAVISAILHANLDRGRVEYFIGEDLNCVGEYVQRVVDQHARLNPYIKAVQSDRSDEVWLPLFKRLHLWAYNFLLRKNFVPGPDTSVIAEECATAAAIKILDAYFPYDVEFDPWARVIVTNTCLHYFRDETKKSVVPPQNLVELDEKLPALNEIGPLDQENKDDLLKAMSRLSGARRQMIQLHYLDELPLPEVAKAMGKSIGAIHSLHFNALQDLRKILGENGNNI